MKQEDIDRLKEICEKEGFELSYEIDVHNPMWFRIDKKDPWEGVEFVECVINSESYTVGKIYKINMKFVPFIKTYQDDFGRENGQAPSYFKPSTEAAYVEQLKKEAFERYGDIQEWDRFQFDGEDIRTIMLDIRHDFDYFKEVDEFSLWGFTLYKQSKWAKKLPERVAVKWGRVELSKDSNLIVNFILSKSQVIKSTADIGDFLASQFEKYLNNEINE